jgi:CHASE2 domain-containing sensor protein
MVQGRLFQDAWNLACFSAAGIGVALTLNWRNNRWGYWINLAVIGVADIGFIIFVLVPGYVPPWPGLLGPFVWLVGLALTTIGLTQGRQR